MKYTLSILILLTVAACSAPVDQAPPPTALIVDPPQATLIPAPTATPIPAPTQVPTLAQPTVPLAFCSDPLPKNLISTLGNAFATRDGALLASLVSPTRGMDVLFYRNGKAVNYDVEHAKFIFETTYAADWGLSFGSGDATLGSFQDVVLPSLQTVFTPQAELICNQLKLGGATYVGEWPYPYLDYYSVHFAGTDQFGGLNWQTWGVGIENVAGQFYVAALVHYVWEP
ncbi:MAG: hypothetical protein IT310_12070 [Anaerolineales bacterium]|nr:hypothetical protein [Anaerolineales bacterium]